MLNHRVITAIVLAIIVFGVIFYFPLWAFSSITVLLTVMGAWELALIFWPPLQPLSSFQHQVESQLDDHIKLQLQSEKLKGRMKNLHPFFFSFVILSIATVGILYSSFLAFSILVAGAIWWQIAFLILIYSVKCHIDNFKRYCSKSSNHEFQNNESRLIALKVLFDSNLTFKPLVKYLIGISIFVPFAIAVNVLQVQFGPLYLCYALILVCANDIGAYFIGSFYGKHVFAPTISPKKTLEGLCGGIVLSCVVIICGGFLLKIHGIRWLLWIVMGIAVGLWSVIGDLFESMLKRQAKVKDSGNLLPGHGGIYDRIDSLTAALPIFALCMLFTNFH